MKSDSSDMEHPLVIDGLNASWHTDPVVLEHLMAGGVTAVNATVAANHDTEWTLKSIARVLSFIDQHPESTLLVESVADIDAAQRSGRVGYIIGFQDTMPIGDDIRLLAAYHKLGVRCIQLTYNFENLVGYGCQSESDQGLTEFGKEVVDELNRLGIVIDLSHCGPRTTLDAIAASRIPVAITHANSTGTQSSSRNKSPEAIRAAAAAGGVVGAVAVPFLLPNPGDATIEDYVGAIDELVEVVGSDNVGLGPDFMEAMPAEVAATVMKGMSKEVTAAFAALSPMQGFASPADYPKLRDALSSRGYSQDDLGRIMGENWRRLYSSVWR